MEGRTTLCLDAELSADRVRYERLAENFLGMLHLACCVILFAGFMRWLLVRSLNGKFEHYDLPDTRLEGDVHVSGDIKVAWFKDPDGNILSVVNR